MFVVFTSCIRAHFGGFIRNKTQGSTPPHASLAPLPQRLQKAHAHPAAPHLSRPVFHRGGRGGDAGKRLVIFNLHTAVRGSSGPSHDVIGARGPSAAGRAARGKSTHCQRGEKTFPLTGGRALFRRFDECPPPIGALAPGWRWHWLLQQNTASSFNLDWIPTIMLCNRVKSLLKTVYTGFIWMSQILAS